MLKFGLQFLCRNQVLLFSLVSCLNLGVTQKTVSDSTQNKTAPTGQRQIGVDYLHFWLIWTAQRSGNVESVYLPADHPAILTLAQSLAEKESSQRLSSHLAQNAELYETGLQPTGSPLLYGLLGVLRTGSYEFDFWLFQIVSSLLFVVGVCLLGRISKINTATCLVICLGLFILFRPLRVDFGVANTNRIQLFLFGLIAWLLAHKKPFFLLAGLVMGFSIAFKLNFALVPVFVVGGCLIDGRYGAAVKIATGSLAGTAASVLFGAWLFGSVDCWMLWRDYVAEVMREPYSIDAGNYSTTSLLGTVSNRYIPVALIFLVFAVWLMILLPRLRSTKNVVLPLPLLGSLSLLVFLFVSPLVWSHYFVLAIPAIVLVTARKLNRHSTAAWLQPASRMTITACLLFVAASTPLAAALSAAKIAVTIQVAVLLLMFAALAEIADIDAAAAARDGPT